MEGRARFDEELPTGNLCISSTVLEDQLLFPLDKKKHNIILCSGTSEAGAMLVFWEGGSQKLAQARDQTPFRTKGGFPGEKKRLHG